MAKAECENTRKQISESVNWINRMDYRLDIEDAGYEEQTRELNVALSAARSAFEGKPAACQMVEVAEDSFICETCGFEESVNVMDS
jgi:hypothetical protein